MASVRSTFTWSFTPYLSSEDLAEINQQFDAVLKDTQCLVFWTGVYQPRVQQWANERGLKTLTSAMGPLMDVRNPKAARYRMDQTEWTMYMKGASACFATFACQGRQALVLTRPPPNIYSDRVTSTYKLIEEPILKGEFGGPCVTSINYIHFTTEDATDFQYQIWPQDHSIEWSSFLERLKIKVRNCADKTSKCIKSSLGLQHQDIQKTVQQQKTLDEQMRAQAKKEAKKAKKARKAAKKARKEAKKEVTKGAKKESDRQKVQDKQMQAQGKKQAREQKLREKQMRAHLKQETKEQKLREEEIRAQLKKKAKVQKVKVEHSQAQAKKQSKRQIAKDEQLWAEAEKEAKRQIAEQTQARMNKETKKNAEQQRIQAKQRLTQVRQEAKRQQVLAELMRAQIEKWAKEKQQREERMQTRSMKKAKENAER